MVQADIKHRMGGSLCFLLLAVCLLSSCAESRKDIVPSADYAPYINAYTGGIVSQRSAIRVELTRDQPMVDLNNELKENPFSFSPSLRGKTYWVNNNTLEFVPEEGALKPGTCYEADFRLGDFADVEKRLKTFRFSFRVQERNFALHTEAISLTEANPDRASIKGEIRFSDIVKKEEAEKMLSARDKEGKQYPLTLTPTDHAARFAFEATGIPRQAKDYQLTITADGTPAGIGRKQETAVLIPARGSFRFLSAKRIGQPENGIEIAFSSPLSATQNLHGLIEVPEVANTILQVKENKAYLYFEQNRLEKLTLNIHEGVKDCDGKPLGKSHSIAFSEVNLKPQVELSASSAILPDSKNLLIPFRAVNLYAVDLNVIRIYESNVLTFMQTNTLASANELRRLGRLVYKKTLWLAKDTSKEIHNWEDYSIDLAGLINQEPGAIYRVILSFRQEYSAYPCGEPEEREMKFADGAPSDGLTKVGGDAIAEEEEAAWDIPQSYFYYNGGVQMDWSQYDWKERNNPCHPSYYMDSDRAASCNVFASDIGMIVKRNSLNNLWMAVSNLLDTKPIGKAKVTAYNFQLQPVGSGETDSDGFAEITPKGVPFIVVAEAGKQKAYVRVVDGEEQSVSRFDVGGKEIRKGLKGFIYGERGVWRPGDTLRLSFILEDREQRIPDKHPVALEVYNPKGQFHTKMISTQGTNGFYTFAVPTQAEDPTGHWNAYIKVGGTAFHKSLRIETIKPNRLKIDLKLPQEVIPASEKEVPVELSSAWLTGATAAGLKTKVEMSLSKVNTQFKRYGQYLFNNPATEFTTVKTDLFEGSLGSDGKTAFTWKLPGAANAPGMLNATLTTRVFEPGGDASTHVQTVPYSPFASYVGINLNQPKGKFIETDKEHRFDIVTVDSKGAPVSRSDLEYKVYRISWSWWWEKQDESFGTYINSSSVTPVASGTLHTTGGKGSFTFRVDYPDWGRYLVYVKDKESGHATGGTVYVDWPEWRGRSGKTDPSGIKMLAFSLDKESYEIGETATAILPAAAGGRALVSLENGSTVLKREWIEVSNGKDTKYSFKITPEMAPNVYLHISLLQPHAQTVNDLPIRMYGVMPVSVTNRQTILQPQIRMPEVLRPESAFNITVSEKSGKPMTYTLAIVDDGLLDLTNFKTPDPWNEFYAREALGIRTWDMYDDVLGAFAGRYASLFSTGGDETLKPADAKANRFKPVVRFIGPYYIGKGKQQTHTIKLPMYVGSVRTMVVAGQDGAYGCAEKSSFVRTPLMLLSTLPRVLGTQEEISIPVNVFAMEKEVKDVTVTARASGAGVQITGDTRQSVTFGQPGDRLLFFKLKTGGKTGKATITLSASGNGQQTRETVEIEVRNPNPAVTLRSSQWIKDGQSATLAYGLQGAAPSGSSVRLEVSRIPPVDINRRLDFLYNYPHHCTEQLTSKALPLLFADRFKSLDNAETEKIKTNVQEAIRQLYARQLPNGGFVYWPGNAAADEWVTSYAGMFLVLAQEKGYAVNQNVLAKWKRFQRAAAQNYRTPEKKNGRIQWQSDLQQAYRLYTLALAGAPEHGAMNRMKEQPSLSLQARWRLAAAYALAGKTKPAGELVYNTETTVSRYSSQNFVYGSSDRDEAMILETLILMDRQQEAMRQARKVSQNLAQEERFSTQSTAFALMAMGRLAEKLSGTLDFTWSLNGKRQPAVQSAKPVFEQALPALSGGNVTVQNRGKGVLGVDIISRMQLLNDTLPAMSDNLRLDVVYTDMNGSPIPVGEIRQGTDFLATVTVGNISVGTDYSNLALTHIIPSGWEIYNERMMAPEAVSARSYSYQDIRDDRVLTYFDLRRGESKRFTVRLQATYVGNFILPAIQCEAMYDPTAQARSQAGRTIVSR